MGLNTRVNAILVVGLSLLLGLSYVVASADQSVQLEAEVRAIPVEDVPSPLSSLQKEKETPSIPHDNAGDHPEEGGGQEDGEEEGERYGFEPAFFDDAIATCMKVQSLDPGHAHRNSTSTSYFRAYPGRGLVEINPNRVPGQDDANRVEALGPSTKRSIVWLASCIEFVFRAANITLADTELVLQSTNASFFKERAKVAEVAVGKATVTDIERVWETPLKGIYSEERVFKAADNGEETEHQEAEENVDEEAETIGGNRVVFLNGFIERHLQKVYENVVDLAQKAITSSVEADGVWDFQAIEPQSLGVRCAELLRYTASKGDHFSRSLGWHVDTDSVYTMVLMLSRPDIDFKGGRFHIADNNGLDSVVEISEGGGVIFDSDKDHAVAPVTRGDRIVLVFEFWAYESYYGPFRPALEVEEEDGVDEHRNGVGERDDGEGRGEEQRGAGSNNDHVEDDILAELGRMPDLDLGIESFAELGEAIAQLKPEDIERQMKQIEE